MNNESKPQTSAIAALGLRIPLLVATAAALLDLFLWVPGPGLLVATALAVSGFLLALYFRYAEDARASVTFSGACIYGIAALLIFGGVRYQVQQERMSAAVLIVAVESYHQRKGEWPPHLDALVPRYMKQIPVVSLRPGHVFELKQEPPRIILHWLGTLPGSAYEYNFVLGHTLEQRPLSGGLMDFFRPHFLARNSKTNHDG